MVSVRRRLVAYKAVVIMVLGSFLMSCNCSRQSLRGEAAAKFEHVTKDVGLLGDRHNPALGYKKHDDVEKNGDGGVKMTGTSELRLSSKRRLVSSQKSMMSHEKKIISGATSTQIDDLDSKKFIAVQWHTPPPNIYDHSPTFHVDYSAPKTHPPKNNR